MQCFASVTKYKCHFQLLDIVLHYTYRWASDQAPPSVDLNQDVIAPSSEQMDRPITFRFTRARVTGDMPPVDVALNDSVYLLWALAPNNNLNPNDPNSIVQHDTNTRGVSEQTIRFPSAADCPAIGESPPMHLLSCVYLSVTKVSCILI